MRRALRERMMMLSSVATIAGASALLLVGCYRPEGAMMSYAGEAQTYYSTEVAPKTVVVVDTRNEETIFEIAVPPGKQLVFDFDDEGGNDPVNRPSLMRWEIMDIGKKFGRLSNSQPAPPAWARRVDFYVREGVEYAAEPPEYRLRPENTDNAPDWWQPDAGPIDSNDNAKTTLYDG